MKSIFFGLLLMISVFSSCTKKNELEELSPESNIFYIPNQTYSDFFVIDSVKIYPYPYVRLYYRLNPQFITNPSKIYRIVVYKDGDLKFRLDPALTSSYKPADNDVYRFQTYTYSFALQEEDGSITKFSPPVNVYIP